MMHINEHMLHKCNGISQKKILMQHTTIIANNNFRMHKPNTSVSTNCYLHEL